MADSKIAIAKTLVNEGGYVDNPNDSGGPTKYGVTQRDLPGEDIKNLTPERATAYYLEHYWKALYSQIDNQSVADKLFDMGVLFGVGEAVKLLQIVLNIVPVDDIFGPHTLSAVNLADPNMLLVTYKTALVTYCIGIANDRPQDRVFLNGWIKRVNS
jgi:lysozyme family protein